MGGDVFRGFKVSAVIDLLPCGERPQVTLAPWAGDTPWRMVLRGWLWSSVVGEARMGCNQTEPSTRSCPPGNLMKSPLARAQKTCLGGPSRLRGPQKPGRLWLILRPPAGLGTTAGQQRHCVAVSSSGSLEFQVGPQVCGPLLKLPLGTLGIPRFSGKSRWHLLGMELLVAGTVSKAGAALGRAPRGCEVSGVAVRDLRWPPLCCHWTPHCCHIQQLPTDTLS